MRFLQISNHELQRDLCKKIDDFVKNDDLKNAKKILDKDLQQRLGSLYQVEHAEFEKNNT